MAYSSGLLILSNLKKVQSAFEFIKNDVKNIYIHINLENNKNNKPLLTTISKIITKIYQDSILYHNDLDVRVLVTPLKQQNHVKPQSKQHHHRCSNRNFDYIFSDQKLPSEIREEFQQKYNIPKPIIYLDTNNCIYDMSIENLSSSGSSSLSNSSTENEAEIYDNVVLGGTFDRIHIGHKILLTEAVLRARKRLVVGVTDKNMIKSKILYELILPVENRIKDVQDFLNDIDPTLKYDVVPIQDPFGPTKSDPNMDVIIVSSETLRGGQKVNELRVENGLKPLKIHCISLVEDVAENIGENCNFKEIKISSSNQRIDLLGTRINPRPPRPNLPKRPYIIGLAGGIASGKTKMCERFENFGAFVINCDRLAHELYDEPDKICYKKIVDYFGIEILGTNKKIDRKILGNIVFNNSEKLQKLNEIIWPELLLEAKRRIHNEYKKNKFNVCVLEAAALFNAGWESECHEIWSMIISKKEAIKRLQDRNKLSEDEALKRINFQLDNEEIVKRSQVIFSSEWTYECTQEQAEKAWKMLTEELREDNN